MWYDAVRGKKREKRDMNNYVTGSAIKALREMKGYTQRQLAELLAVSDNAVS